MRPIYEVSPVYAESTVKIWFCNEQSCQLYPPSVSAPAYDVCDEGVGGGEVQPVVRGQRSYILGRESFRKILP